MFSSIDSLPSTVQTALEKIERAAGMKAFLLIGGPVPAAGGELNIHTFVRFLFV